MEDRKNLPFRINCEGYFINEEGKILAKDSGKGFIMFPGGGVDGGEDIKLAMARETKEETGLSPENLSELGVLKIVWGPDWAKTEKQKSRFEKFQGDEMHFLTGKVSGNSESSDEEDYWQGEKFMNIADVIEAIEKTKPFEESVKGYREFQLKYLKEILSKSQN